MLRRLVVALSVVGVLALSPLVASAPAQLLPPPGCSGLPNANQLRTLMQGAAVPDNPALTASLRAGTDNKIGGLFEGTRMWGAVVNRSGELCSWNTSTTDLTQVWPGSQAIAKAKGYTANAFSLDILPLSTAQLYTFVQPGHSLFGLNQSNPYNASFLLPPKSSNSSTFLDGLGKVVGGVITFGGGVPLYKNGKIVGGLGISGDTACADHEIAKRTRDLAGLNPGGGPTADDIVYTPPASPFGHPQCPNTHKNEAFVGNERGESYDG